ncbi:MAG: uracil-DNA glycosylase family protein [Tannerellaceae bacterium]|jgi:G:T/U-mismatch repair DNA glycosylase|nr:uracil-DNA glycosylase family protein [Tannerellaceae bacterium]
MQVERHPLGFFLPENARLLMLGSFPPKQELWSMDFYYPNIRNDMWRIMGFLFHSNRDYFLTASRKAFSEERVRAFCRNKGIAIGDTAVEVIRLKDNASDQFLNVVTPLDLAGTLEKIPACKAIVVTGQKAMDTLRTILPVTEPKIGDSATCLFMGKELTVYRMPSSSRRYPQPLHEKAENYRKMFQELGILPTFV